MVKPEESGVFHCPFSGIGIEEQRSQAPTTPLSPCRRAAVCLSKISGAPCRILSVTRVVQDPTSSTETWQGGQRFCSMGRWSSTSATASSRAASLLRAQGRCGENRKKGTQEHSGCFAPDILGKHLDFWSLLPGSHSFQFFSLML